MTNKAITALTSATTPLAGTEVLPIVQSGATVKATVAALTAGRDVTAKTLALDAINYANFPALTLAAGTETSRKYQMGMITGGKWALYESVGPTKLVEVDSTGNTTVSIGNLVIGTSGKGIDFSATAGTGTSELLADYEEGTWAPTQGAGLIVVGAFSSSGTYTKIGRQVTVVGIISGATSVATTSGGVMVAGLPFTPLSYCDGTANNANATSGSILAINATTSIYSVSAIAATASIRFAATYFT